MKISDVFPRAKIALELGPEELAVGLLEYLCKVEDEERGTGGLSRYKFTRPDNLAEYARLDSVEPDKVARAVTEAWTWLANEGLIATRPGDGSGYDWIFVTRRGRKFRKQADLKQFKAANLIGSETLDERLAAKVTAIFMRGDYDTAVFQAFKEVEVRVRDLGGYGYTKEEQGVPLMRKAFHREKGNLTDSKQILAEKQAISDLFAGAIGSFKNPGSHRNVNLDNAVEAAELIRLANLLIRIAERHKTNKKEN